MIPKYNLYEVLSESKLIPSKFRESYLKTHHIDVYKDIVLWCIDVDLEYLDFSRKIYHYMNNMTNVPTCNVCGNVVNFKDKRLGYYRTCSQLCSKRDPIAMDKRISTNMVKYGGKAPACSSDVRLKMKESCVELYGVENIFQHESTKEHIKDLMLERYGVDNPSKSEDIKKKKKETCMINYGVEVPLQSNIIREKTKNTVINRYGVSSVMHVREIFSKAKSKSFSKKEYVLPSGRIVEVMGYEPLALDILLKTYKEHELIIEDDEMEKYLGKIYYTGESGRKRRYYPDIFILPENKIIEVKSPYTYEIDENTNKLKEKRCLELGYQYEFMILNK